MAPTERATARPPAWRPPGRGEDALLARALTDFQAGACADALLAAEAACRRHPRLSIPAQLRAAILQALRSPLAAAAWHAAWRRDPLDARLQDALLQAWLARGDGAAVASLGAALLPLRCRAGDHAALLGHLRAAGAAPRGACWKAGDAIEGILFDPDAGGVQLLLHDELGQRRHAFRLAPRQAGDGMRFRVTPPRPGGVWSLALAGQAAALPGSPLAFRAPAPAAPAHGRTRAALTVLIPIHGGLEHARACVASVLASLPRNRTGARLLLVDDASPGAALPAWLATLGADRRVTVLCNRYNLGFIESVNRGLRACPGHDVLLLNADTLVHGDWIDRLRAALYAAPDIAAVTPWSNNGEISSFPAIGRAAPAPDLAALARIDDAAAALRRAGDSADVEVPACCGFAMLMRAGALAAVGLLDGAALERGYGEEVDWCQRARAAGYRHLVATGVFVAHAGSVSFGDEKHLRVRQNRAVLAQRYPDYYPQYQRFLRDDPLARARASLERAMAVDLKNNLNNINNINGINHINDINHINGINDYLIDAVTLPRPLASGCIRIGVWGHRTRSPAHAQVLALARLLAARAGRGPALRLLVFGEMSEPLWATGVVDAMPPADAADVLLADVELLGLAGCAALLAAGAAPGGVPQVRLEAGFDARRWLEGWLATLPAAAAEPAPVAAAAPRRAARRAALAPGA